MRLLGRRLLGLVGLVLGDVAEVVALHLVVEHLALAGGGAPEKKFAAITNVSTQVTTLNFLATAGIADFVDIEKIALIQNTFSIHIPP